MDTRTTGAGIHLIKRFEKLALQWYLCPAGVWSIGYGITENLLSGVNRRALSRGIDAGTADWLLHRALTEIFEPAVERLVDPPLGALLSYQFDALTSFVFNVGEDAFAHSTMRRHINEGRHDRAAAEFSRWIYADGRVLKGLIKRREAERSMFEGETTRALEVRPERLAPMAVERADIEIPRLERLRGYVPTASDIHPEAA